MHLLQVAGLRHAVLGTLGDRKAPLLRCIEKSLLEHGHPEIQQCACVAIARLTPCLEPPVVQALIHRFAKLAECRDSHSQSGESSSDDRAAYKRHAGVLGMGGMLCAFPYSIPDWAPVVVERIASHAFDPCPVDSTVRKLLSEFKRTHMDAWESEHRSKFDAQQLSALNDALVVPSSMFA